MNMKKLILPVLLSPLLIFSGCRKDDPQIESGTPVFMLQGTLNNSPITIQAGVNGYYMYSSYSSGADSVYTFTGDLHQESCSGNCPNSLQVYIRDYQPHGSTGTTNIDSALRLGAYAYFDTLAQQGMTVLFSNQVSNADSVFSYNWNFGDNSTSTLPNPIHNYVSPGMYNVCLTSTYMHNNVTNSHTFCDSVPVSPGGPCFSINTTTTPLGGNFFMDSVLFNASVTGGGVPPFTYLWDFGDSIPGSGNPAMHVYTPAGKYAIRLTVTDASSCTMHKRKEIQTSQCDSTLVNFDWTQQPSSMLNLSTVKIQWIDGSGTHYRTDWGTQPSNSSFQLLSVDPYDRNENGQLTKKIHARVTCKLYDSIGQNFIQLSNADIVFAVAYP